MSDHDDEARRGLRRPGPSPAGSERPSRRPSSARLDAMQVAEEHLVAQVRVAIRSAIGRGFDLGTQATQGEIEAAQRAVARADAAQLEYQRDLRQARDDLDAAREEIRLRGERIQDIQQAIDETTAELHRAWAQIRRLRPERESVTQMQVPMEQERLRQRARAKSEADFRRLSSRPKGDE